MSEKYDRAWDLIDEFHPLQAAGLWLYGDVSPSANKPTCVLARKIMDRFRLSSNTEAFAVGLGNAFNGTRYPIPRHSVTRDELKRLAGELDQRPAFLFDGDTDRCGKGRRPAPEMDRAEQLAREFLIQGQTSGNKAASARQAVETCFPSLNETGKASKAGTLQKRLTKGP